MFAWLQQAMFENFGLKAFSFLLASCLLLYVRADQHVFSTVEVKLELKYAEDMLLITRPVTSLSVTLHGPSSKIRRIEPQLSYTLDLSKLPDGTHQQEIFLEQLRPLFPTVRVTRITPSVLDFRLEKATTKTLPIKVLTKGSKEGYELVLPPLVTPANLVIRGSKSDLEKKTEIQTEVVDTSKLERNTQLRLSLEKLTPPMEYLGLGKKTKVQVSLQIRKLLSEKTFTSLPIRLGYAVLPFQVEIKPPSLPDVTLQGPLLSLRRLQADQILLQADGRKLPSLPGTYTLPLLLKTPEPELVPKNPLPTVVVVLSPLPPSPKGLERPSLPDTGPDALRSARPDEAEPAEGSPQMKKKKKKKKKKKDPSETTSSPPEKRAHPTPRK